MGIFICCDNLLNLLFVSLLDGRYWCNRSSARRWKQVRSVEQGILLHIAGRLFIFSIQIQFKKTCVKKVVNIFFQS